MNESNRSPTREKIRITVDLPLSLRERIQGVLERGAARSQNALITQAVEQFLEAIERAQIDDQFAEMADDPAYRALQLKTAEEFAPTDWDAWQAVEADDAKG